MEWTEKRSPEPLIVLVQLFPELVERRITPFTPHAITLLPSPEEISYIPWLLAEMQFRNTQKNNTIVFIRILLSQI
jgi:hypothetical protein